MNGTGIVFRTVDTVVLAASVETGSPEAAGASVRANSSCAADPLIVAVVTVPESRRADIAYTVSYHHVLQLTLQIDNATVYGGCAVWNDA